MTMEYTIVLYNAEVYNLYLILFMYTVNILYPNKVYYYYN